MLRPSLLGALQVTAGRDAIAVAADVASIVIAGAVLALVAIMGLLFLRLHGMLAEMRLGVRQNLGPVSDRARAISDNVEFITQVLRSDVESLNESVQSLSERLSLASDRMEERIEEFNALMEVVQGEAETLFIDTAATVRGVRAGARSMITSSETPADEAPERPGADAMHAAGRRVAGGPAPDGDALGDGTA
jgi:hypothetical protein